MNTTVVFTVQDRYKNILGVYDSETIARNHAAMFPGRLKIIKTTTTMETIVEIAPEEQMLGYSAQP